MKKKLVLFAVVLFAFSLNVLSARGSRVNLVPYGSTYSCNLCHTAGGGTPRNSFGQSVEAITGSNEISFWGATLAATDSDADGFTNGIELQDSAGTWTSGSSNPGNSSLVTHPGDNSDFPATSLSLVPVEYKLGNNYPNPFNPFTVISYDLPLFSDVHIDVYNILGEKICDLVNESQTAGVHTVAWNGQDDLGNTMNSGLYFYRLRSGNYSKVKRMVMIK